ncbi:nitrate ABC transporter substrate-binding protein [Planctomycetota bacterium]|nr:nitrate ABC transporter substrate-binding protein [Planctomycetota bacterium]
MIRALVPVLLAVCAAAADLPAWTVKNPTPDFKKVKANGIEKPTLKFGMIKLTDCVPIVAARELGYFAEEGLNVSIEVQPSWKAVMDRLVSGELDGSHCLYNMPLGAAIGAGAQAELVVAYNICINGMGITVSNGLWAQAAEQEPRLKEPGYSLPVSATVIRKVADARKTAGKEPLRFFMTFPAGSHNMTLRYWLGAGGVHPGYYDGPADSLGKRDADVVLTVNPPPQMASAMAQGNCDGFCVGEPWNMQVTLKDGTGRPINPSQYVFDGAPDKVFAVSKVFAEKNPKTLHGVVRALIRAGKWLDATSENRRTAIAMLACKEYIAANPEVLAESMVGTYVYGVKDGALDRRPEPDFNVFYRRHASFPWHSHAVWGLTQMRRWGMVGETKPDAWYHDVAKKVNRTEIYRTAFASLLAEGKVSADELPAEDSRSYPADAFIDKIPFDPATPNDYLGKFAIGLK